MVTRPTVGSGKIRNLAKWLVPLCLVAALVFFLWPKPGPYETDIFVPLEITALPEGLTLAAMPLKGVEIRVRGPEKVVRNLPRETLAYRLDLKGAAAGVKTVSMRAESFGLPPDVTILHAHPYPLILKIES